MPIVVFDTVIFVRALLNRRSVWAHIVFNRRAAYTLVVSLPILREVIEVRRRPELARRFPIDPDRNVAAVLGVLDSASVVSIDEDALPRICRDPKDDKFVATAVEAGAAYLVSEDNDLLVLGTYGDVQIVDAATFLATLSS
ncbi:MAG TPA: putative toxin-antitoxin system toxin component, PIN family [Thermomicrobiales bacterium]|nr:putative toxin-antitoxin system toxin component, PIN family [Thermomicrobiales bacterium]